MEWVQCLTCVFNLLFAVSGVLILLVGAAVQFNYAHYSNFVSDQIWTTPIILMIIGAVFAFTFFLGCYGATTQNICMISLFVLLGLTIFFIEIGLGVAAYYKHTDLSQIMEAQFNNTISQYNEREDYRDGWTLLQAELGCCGTYGPSDWQLIFPNETVPSACCRIINLNEAEVCTVAYAYQNGCLHKLWEILDSKTLTLTRVALGVAAVQVLTIILACCRCR